MSENYTRLPPGWDTKFSADGKCYYINYLTKAIQLEDPRLSLRYKQLQNERCSTESIPMQQMHGSPYHVYPTNNFPAVKAFQSPIPPSLQNVSASPLLSTKSQLSSTMEMSPVFRPLSSEATTPRNNYRRRDTIQETSFTNQIDVNATVAKIQNMFPTAEENHIRLLLKRYYNREAVVISALQVEKHPVTMPGPFATPPAQRHLFHMHNSSGHIQIMTPPPSHSHRLDLISRTGSPSGRFNGSITSNLGSLLYGSPRFGEQIPLIRNSPKPHSSPKMKLRYMKNIFPKADETLILDILANSDNNVQKASEILIAMGYQKRDFNPPKLSNREGEKLRKEKEEKDAIEAEKIIPLRPKELTDEDKQKMQKELKEHYPKIADRIVLMALESVNYSEDRANEILKIVQQEENDTAIARKDSEKDDKISVKTRKDDSSSMKDSQDILIVEKIDDDTLSPNSSIVVTMNEIGHPPSTSSNLSSNNLLYNKNKNINKIECNNINLEIKGSKEYLNCDENVKIIENPSKSSSSSTTWNESSLKYRPRYTRVKPDFLKNSVRGSTQECEDESDAAKKAEFQSILGRIAALGHSSKLVKGADDTLLLPDYVSWNGANPNNTIGRQGLAGGSDPNMLNNERYITKGHNSDLCKGPKGIAKGSIYSQISTTNIKCN